jgi:hypothetical protein
MEIRYDTRGKNILSEDNERGNSPERLANIFSINWQNLLLCMQAFQRQ